MTIQNYPGEAVWFDGSVPITNWAQAGYHLGHLRLDSHSSAQPWAATPRSRPDSSAANTMAANPDEVFVNGTQLKQVSSAAKVVDGTFYVSDAANTITIGSDPSGKDVRASDLAQAIILSGPNSVIQGIGVRRYANGYEKGGAVRIGNTGGTIRNVVIQDVATDRAEPLQRQQDHRPRHRPARRAHRHRRHPGRQLHRVQLDRDQQQHRELQGRACRRRNEVHLGPHDDHRQRRREQQQRLGHLVRRLLATT